VRRPVALAILIALAGCARADEPPPAPQLTIDVRARAIAPGEPLRVDVRATAPLRALEGEMLGAPIHFVRSGERWSGWALIRLAQAPGPATIDVRGEDEQGRAVQATRDVTIEAKEFPSEKLEVAPGFVEPSPEVQKRIERERERTKAIYAQRRDVLPPSAPFVRPVPGEPTSIFGMRRFFNDEPRDPHPGLDLRAKDGTPVHCSGPGMVALAGDLYFSGKTVIVDHGGGLFTVYAHLSKIDVQEQQELVAGTLVGRSGHTGRVTGPHLHWGAKIGDDPFDPTALLDPTLFR
jgi:murein DD-endopeptidase MepM/ murein hydrolase activator NlpD